MFPKSYHPNLMKLVEGGFYDKYRPTYTDEVANKVLEIIRNNELTTEHEKNIKYDILELGAGTGKFTKKLKEKIKQETLLASDPSEGFLTVLQQSCPDVECSQFAANNIPLPDSSVKAVVCAMCFHWFSNAVSLSEIERVLVPGGLIFLVYYNEDRRYPVVDEVIARLREYIGDNLSPELLKSQDIFKETKSFKKDQDIILDGIKFEGPLDDFYNYVCSFSFIVNKPDDVKARIKQEMTEIFQYHMGDQTQIDVPFYSMINVYKKTVIKYIS